MKKIVHKNNKVLPQGAKWAAKVLAEKFQPDRIYLFGSHAYGRPNKDSDIDLLVVKKTQKPRELSVKMDGALEDRQFPLDLLVYSPERFDYRMELGDPFLRLVVRKGILLYDATT